MVLSERHFEIDNVHLKCKWRGSNCNDHLLQAMDKLAPEISIHIWGQPPGKSDIIHYFDPPQERDDIISGSIVTPYLAKWDKISDKDRDFFKDRLKKAGKIVDIGLSLHPYLKEFEDKTYVIPPGFDQLNKNYEQISMPGNRPFKIVLNGKCDEEFIKAKAPENVDLIVINKPGPDTDQVKNVSITCHRQRMNLLYTADAVVVGKEDLHDGYLLFQAMASKSVVICPFDRKYGGTPNSRFALDSSRNIEQALYAFAGLSYDERERMIKECESIMADYTWSHTAHCLRLIYHIISGSR